VCDNKSIMSAPLLQMGPIIPAWMIESGTTCKAAVQIEAVIN
jgi:hypothetical protein